MIAGPRIDSRHEAADFRGLLGSFGASSERDANTVGSGHEKCRGKLAKSFHAV